MTTPATLRRSVHPDAARALRKAMDTFASALEQLESLGFEAEATDVVTPEGVHQLVVTFQPAHLNADKPRHRRGARTVLPRLCGLAFVASLLHCTQNVTINS